MQNKNLNYEKYLKYKNKYLNLMNQIVGGRGDGDKSCIKITPADNSDDIITVNINIFNNNLNGIFQSFQLEENENNIVVELTNFYCGILCTFLLNNLEEDAILFYKTVVSKNEEVANAVLEEFRNVTLNDVVTRFLSVVNGM
jgi:hypothetical protein